MNEELLPYGSVVDKDGDVRHPDDFGYEAIGSSPLDRDEKDQIRMALAEQDADYSRLALSTGLAEVTLAAVNTEDVDPQPQQELAIDTVAAAATQAEALRIERREAAIERMVEQGRACYADAARMVDET